MSLDGHGFLFMTKALRSGWGRSSWASVNYLPLSGLTEVSPRNENLSNEGIVVGLGRSYGDTSLNSKGVTWTTEHLRNLKIDTKEAVAVCGSGVSIGELERAASMVGLFPSVVPGTEFVTVGGAIASNIHGKSHHTDGSFGDHVIEIKIANNLGEISVLTPDGEGSEEFWATIGGLGLTGAIIEAKIRLKPIQTTFMQVEEVRVHNLSEMLRKLEEFDSKFTHTVAWIDLSGSYKGRGIVGGGKQATRVDLRRNQDAYSQKLPRKFSLPKKLPFSLINSFSVSTFNMLWFYKPLKKGLLHFQPFLHPLDSIRNWNVIYGRRGFLQYQFAIPYDKEFLLFEFVELMKLHKTKSFLTVLKRLDAKRSNFLSFPLCGWTLAVDFSASDTSFIKALEKFDEELTKAGGRIYLTKDSRLGRRSFESMYPEFKEWRKIKNLMDPENYWQSDQGKRLGLC